MPSVASMMEASRGMVYVLIGIVYIAIGIVILNAMLMSVFERVREFGVLKAIGMEPATVLAIVFCESLMQTLIAVAAGLLFSIPGVYYLQVHGIDQGALGGATVAGMAIDPILRASFSRSSFVGPVVTLIV